MFVGLLVVTSLVISQTDEAPAEPKADAPAAAPTPDAAPATPAVKASPPINSRALEETTKLYSKWSTFTDNTGTDQYIVLRRLYGHADYNQVLPPAEVVFGDFMKLSETDQAKVIARRFMEDLISGDPLATLKNAGLPFMVEDHRYDRAEDLRDVFARQLRKKRSDRWTLYDITVLQPADMEKKYGKPPTRLNAWGWKTPKTVVAVCSVSGHATVLMLKQVGATWQVVGFHD